LRFSVFENGLRLRKKGGFGQQQEQPEAEE